jgi:hypothetical protein
VTLLLESLLLPLPVSADDELRQAALCPCKRMSCQYNVISVYQLIEKLVLATSVLHNSKKLIPAASGLYTLIENRLSQQVLYTH